VATHDAGAIVTPKPAPGTVHLFGAALVVVTAHPGLFPDMVLVASEAGLCNGSRFLTTPATLAPSPDPWATRPDDWDAHVLQALAAVAPNPHLQH